MFMPPIPPIFIPPMPIFMFMLTGILIMCTFTSIIGAVGGGEGLVGYKNRWEEREEKGKEREKKVGEGGKRLERKDEGGGRGKRIGGRGEGRRVHGGRGGDGRGGMENTGEID